jgi:hypothetical protein
MAYQLHCTVRQQSNSDTCSEVPTTVLSARLSADGQVIIARTDSALLMDTQRLNELVTKCLTNMKCQKGILLINSETGLKFFLCAD